MRKSVTIQHHIVPPEYLLTLHEDAGVVGVSGLTSATGSASMTGAMSMPGGGLGLGVPITTLTTTNEGIAPFLPS